MEYSIISKTPKGKLFRLELDYSNKIDSIKISGDFFIYPEESIWSIEKELVGVKMDDFIETFNSYVENNNVELIGITSEALYEAIKKEVEK